MNCHSFKKDMTILGTAYFVAYFATYLAAYFADLP